MHMEPTTKARVTPKDFFLNLGAILSLYIVAVSFITFIFNVINTVFPDRQNTSYDPYSTAIRLAVSTLIIVFPTLLFLGRLIHKNIQADPSKRDLALRKWLIYLTLFITGVTIAIDLIVLLNTFLSGEVTTRFILKVVAIFITAGLIFWYYISDLRGTYNDSPKKLHAFYWLVSAVVLVSVVGGFVLIGSPSTQRKLKDDTQRVDDLNGIQWQVVNHYQQTGKLPVSLAELSDPISSYMIPKDPATGEAYVYKTLMMDSQNPNPTFELCATFDLKSDQPMSSARYYDLSKDENWAHEAGPVCFKRTIDPAKYPVYPKNPASVVR